MMRRRGNGNYRMAAPCSMLHAPCTIHHHSLSSSSPSSFILFFRHRIIIIICHRSAPSESAANENDKNGKWTICTWNMTLWCHVAVIIIICDYFFSHYYFAHFSANVRRISATALYAICFWCCQQLRLPSQFSFLLATRTDPNAVR